MDIVRIGRSSDNDIVFNETEVSRYHCELYCSNGRVYIKDLGSTNGTQVNGRTISSPVSLKKGDRVMLGHKVPMDWYDVWTQFYSYPMASDDYSETIRYDGGHGRTIRYDVPDSGRGRREPSSSGTPIVNIPSNININHREEYSEVLKSGDDFKVPLKRNLGKNVGHHVGNTLGCIISIIIVAAILAIVGSVVL